jgi:hypothetical protein
MRGGLIGFALYSKKACSLINPFDAGALNVIRLGRSLCFFYAKQVPFAETNERILVGVGRVSAMGRLREYVKGDPNGFGAWVWERSVIHSIRAPDFTDGFLLPYHMLMEKAAADPSLNPADFLALAPNDTPGRRDEFSYVTEHVSNGAAILRMKDVVPGDRSTMLDWINERLTEVWRIRGAFPGLGSVLTAFGVPEGAFVAASDRDREGHRSRAYAWNQFAP